MSRDVEEKVRREKKGNKTKISKEDIGPVSNGSFQAKAKFENTLKEVEQVEEEAVVAVKERFSKWKREEMKVVKNPMDVEGSQSTFWEREFQILAQSSAATWEASNQIEAIALLKTTVKQLVKLFLESRDSHEFMRCINELDYRIGFHLVAKVILSMSLDEKEDNQNAILSLLKECVDQEEGLLTVDHLMQGFRLLVVHVDDIALDIPNVKSQLCRIAEHGIVRGFLPEEVSHYVRVLKLNKTQVDDVFVKVDSMLKEYFVSEILEELVARMDELDHDELYYEIIRRGVTLAIEKSGRERQLMSILIATLAGDVIERPLVEIAFELLIESVEDEIIDSPNYMPYLAAFIARAISDEAIAPIWLDRVNLHPSDLGYKVINQSQLLLAGGVGNPARLMHIWGKFGNRAVSELRNDIIDLLKEYFESHILEEAMQCISDLNAVFFHHEIVYKAFVIALDLGGNSLEYFEVLMKALFKEFPNSSQIQSGFHRIAFQLGDIILDAPSAKDAFEKSVVIGKNAGYLNANFA